jgi:hypothetical protein
MEITRHLLQGASNLRIARGCSGGAQVAGAGAQIIHVVHAVIGGRLLRR